ncbi:pimeloyl-ACP methyl ester carboxylesterase [Kribbella voronezhensis]|uniref:Pimeloyl-ACP methyl ester carboxylesterase n=1 Tax=Kribbella voronezhensis TaxID=2512212 RepID=A0A4R7SYW8_9ACTN|nr:alpha/beta hydrolase [Kribbella voronezhensis]TDU84225.1 pimeloyl-ACP methyl ester carboxylesterase [Kribbella voronezhensis]
MAEHTKDFVDVPGGYLYYEQHGRGPDVVLLGGGLADLRMWDSTVDWLAERARVTTWDYRDTGLSAPAYGPYSEIDDLTAVLDAAGVSQAVLVGVSEGGRRALGFAHRHPERVTHVCAVAPSFGEFPDPSPEEAAAREVMRRHFADCEKVLAADGIPAVAALDVDAWCPAAPQNARRLLIGLQIANARMRLMTEYYGLELDPPIKTRFTELEPPISVLIGHRDFQATQLWAQRLTAQTPNATLTTIPTADHMPMFSTPPEFRDYVLATLPT